MGRFFKNYGLSIALAALFLTSWIGQYYFQWQEYVSTQQIHNAQISNEDFLSEFLAATFENWQSEFLQLFTFVVLTAYLIHKGSHESRDSQDAMQRDIKEIKAMLKKARP